MANSKYWLSAVGGLCVGAIVVGGVWVIEQSMNSAGPVIATVNGQAIHRQALDQQVDQTVGTQTLTMMIEEQMIGDVAKKDGISATTAEVTQARQSMEEQEGITSDQQLASELASGGMSMSQFNAELKAQVLAQKIAEQNVKVTSADIASYYKANKSTFNVPAEVTISGILVKTEADAAKAKASIESGKSFASVAKAVSIDATSKKSGGKMGTFTKAQLAGSLQAPAFTLPIGSASQPIQTSSGWAIIEVTARKAAYTKPLSAAKSQIETTIKQQKAASLQTLMAQLAKTEKISIQDPVYANVLTQIENPSTSSGSTTG